MLRHRGNAVRYVRVHGVRTLMIGMLLAIAINAYFGATPLALPSASKFTDTPMRREVPIIYASLIAGSMSSHMQTFELQRTARLLRADSLYRFLACTGTLLVAGVSEAFFSSVATSVQATRSLIAWTGLAFFGGRFLGWGLSWALPVMTIFPLVYYGHGEGGAVRWWDWTSRPAADPSSWILAATLMAVGLLALWATPWRLNRIRRVLLRQ